MNETIFSILNIQETWESIALQLNSLFSLERSQFQDALGPFWDKVLDNPLASIITSLVLIGLPYTLIKAKKSSTEASARLDRLMEEMKDFEFEKPVIDLQEKFKGTSFDNSPSTEDYHEVPKLSFEEDPVLHDLESTSFAKKLSLDEKVTDDYLATRSMPLQPEANDENSELSSLAEEILDETKASPPVNSSTEDEDFESLYDEAMQAGNEDRDLVFMAEENLPDEAEIGPTVESSVEEDDTNHDMDDLQTRMEQAIKKLRMNYPSPEETKETVVDETNTDSTSPVLKAMEQSSLHEETTENDTEEDTSHPPPESIPSDSNTDGEERSLKQSHLITHLKSFQKNLETQFDLRLQESKKKINNSPF